MQSEINIKQSEHLHLHPQKDFTFFYFLILLQIESIHNFVRDKGIVENEMYTWKEEGQNCTGQNVNHPEYERACTLF